MSRDTHPQMHLLRTTQTLIEKQESMAVTGASIRQNWHTT